MALPMPLSMETENLNKKGNPSVKNPLTVLMSLRYHATRKKPLVYSFVPEYSDAMRPLTYTVAREPMEVETVLPDGKETKNRAAVGDIVMCGISREKYVIRREKFPSLYTGTVGERVTVAQQSREVARYTGKDTLHFKAPWGEDMVVKTGDYVVKDGGGGGGGHYRIAKSEFERTYEPIP